MEHAIMSQIRPKFTIWDIFDLFILPFCLAYAICVVFMLGWWDGRQIKIPRTTRR